MRFLLSLLVACTLSPCLMAQGVAVRSNDGLATNLIAKGTFRIMSDGVNPGRLYLSGSTTNLAAFQIVGGVFGISVDGGPASTLTSAGDFSAGRNLSGSNVTAIRFIGSGSNLTDIGISSLGFQPATNTFVGITTALGYTPGTNYTYNGEHFHFSGLQLGIKDGANITNATLFSGDTGQPAVPSVDTYSRLLIDGQPELSLDWNNRKLFAQDGSLAAWWKHRQLIDSLGATAIDWEAKTFSAGWTFDGGDVSPGTISSNQIDQATWQLATNAAAAFWTTNTGTSNAIQTTAYFLTGTNAGTGRYWGLDDTSLFIVDGVSSANWTLQPSAGGYWEAISTGVKAGIWFEVGGNQTNAGDLRVAGTIYGNGSGVTNVNASHLVYSTNAHASATNMLDMSKSYADFTATTHMAITNFSNIDPTRENSSVLIVTNGSGGNLTMSLSSGVTTMDGARSCVMSNNTVTIFSFSVYGNRWTNVAYRTFY